MGGTTRRLATRRSATARAARRRRRRPLWAPPSPPPRAARTMAGGGPFVRFFVASPASWSTERRGAGGEGLEAVLPDGDWGASRPSVVSEDDESVEFSKMDQPSTTGPSSSSLSTTVKGDQLCWRGM